MENLINTPSNSKAYAAAPSIKKILTARMSLHILIINGAI